MFCTPFGRTLRRQVNRLVERDATDVSYFCLQKSQQRSSRCNALSGPGPLQQSRVARDPPGNALSIASMIHPQCFGCNQGLLAMQFALLSVKAMAAHLGRLKDPPVNGRHVDTCGLDLCLLLDWTRQLHRVDASIAEVKSHKSRLQAHKNSLFCAIW